MFVALTVLAWLALFVWVDALEVGVIAALLSFIGFCIVFLTARHFALSYDWGLGAAAAVVSPLIGALVAQAWTSFFPPTPCAGDDCVKVIVRMAAES